MRKRVAPWVALGVAEVAFDASETILNDADKGLDVLQEGVDAGWRGTKAGVGLVAAALLAGAGLGVAVLGLRRTARPSTPRPEPVPAAASAADRNGA